MGLGQLLKEPELNEDQRALRQQFFEETGYGGSDILSLSYNTKSVMTQNGGLYRIKEDGTIDHLAGPSPDPSERF